MNTKTILFLPVFVASFASMSLAQGLRQWKLVQTLAFPEVHGGFNHMSVDSAHGRLFAAAPTNGTVEVVDVNSGKPQSSLHGARPAAARYSPEFNQLYVSGPQGVSVYDGTTLSLLNTVNVGGTVDELHYDPAARVLYAGCMTTGKTGIAVIGIPEGKLITVIPLPVKPQGFAVELHGERLFANTPESNSIAVIDRKALKLDSTWPLTGAAGNTPMALDEADHRLFVGARHPPQLVVLNTESGKSGARVRINGVADDMFYDAARQRIYISCGQGFEDLVAQRDPDHYYMLARIPTAPHSGTSAFSPNLHTLFVGTSRQGDSAAMIRVFNVDN